MEKIGILTGGGDCPGLNAVIRSSVMKLLNNDYQVIGFYKGWQGLLENNYTVLNWQDIDGILFRGGTILKSSRTNPTKYENGVEILKKNISKLGLKSLIVIGGEDTLGVANVLHHQGIKVIGVPKTIDNDLMGTDYTFGFDTAVSIATEAIDRLHTTACSHSRLMVIEVMGRYTGWIALHSGIAGGADFIILPEFPVGVETIEKALKWRFQHRKKDFAIVVIAEGAKVSINGNIVVKNRGNPDEFGHVLLGGIGSVLSDVLSKRLNIEGRELVLGHLQRGGCPTAYDRVLASRLGYHAAQSVFNEQYGVMIALKGAKIETVSISEALRERKKVTVDLYKEALFGIDMRHSSYYPVEKH